MTKLEKEERICRRLKHNNIGKAGIITVKCCLSVCVCVCMREREREREIHYGYVLLTQLYYLRNKNLFPLASVKV